MNVVDWLTRILGSGITGVVASRIQSWLQPRWAWLDAQDKIIKRTFAWVVACALATGAFYALVWFGALPLPETPQAHVAALFPFWFMAVTASQGTQALI